MAFVTALLLANGRRGRPFIDPTVGKFAISMVFQETFETPLKKFDFACRKCSNEAGAETPTLPPAAGMCKVWTAWRGLGRAGRRPESHPLVRGITSLPASAVMSPAAVCPAPECRRATAETRSTPSLGRARSHGRSLPLCCFSWMGVQVRRRGER